MQCRKYLFGIILTQVKKYDLFINTAFYERKKQPHLFLQKKGGGGISVVAK